MRIVLTQPGITKFLARKDDHGIKEGIDINIVVGVPFEVPDDLAKARIKASPNLFREATEEDEKFAKTYQEQRIAELKELVKVKQQEADAAIKEVEALNKKIANPEKVDEDEFNVAKFLDENEPLTEEKLKVLERLNLLEIAKAMELEFASNIPTVKLIQLILDNTKEE